jgi:signal peptidase I
MAPAIAGWHRVAVCSRCGARALVGSQGTENGKGRHGPRTAFCPNCGCIHLDLDQVPEAPGDQMLVNKSAFLFRRPRRWEVIVFRLFGKTFVKRVIGLAGEIIEILDGDVYVNGELARKTLDEVRAQRILVFDNTCQPGPNGWRARWEVPPGQDRHHPLVGGELRLDGTNRPEKYQHVTYRNYLVDEKKCQPIRDEYGYNGAERRLAEPVHDFMVACDLEIQGGAGSFDLSITDGGDTVIAEIPVGGPATDRRPLVARTPGAASASTLAVPLQPGVTHHLEMAFVDRRLSLAMDRSCPLPPVDLPARGRRPGVDRPVTLGVRGAKVAVRNFRLYRDVHYTQAGRNAVGGKAVHLAAAEYFVLGDNSSCSDDSRFWPHGGAVPASSLVGKPFLVHLPTRVATWELFGRRWQPWIPDLARIRWLR